MAFAAKLDDFGKPAWIAVMVMPSEGSPKKMM